MSQTVKASKTVNATHFNNVQHKYMELVEKIHSYEMLNEKVRLGFSSGLRIIYILRVNIPQ